MHRVRSPGIQVSSPFQYGIVKVYHRTPTQVPAGAQKGTQASNHYLFRLHFRPPYHWQGMLDFLAPRRLA
jgi:hypothetical protein